MPHAALISRSQPPLPAASRRAMPEVFEQAIGAAISHLSSGRASEALACLDRLDARRATSLAHCTLVGRVCLSAGAPDIALAWFDAALALGGNDPEALLNRANALLALDRAAEALDGFERAFQAGAVDPVGCYNYGILLYRAGRLDAALAAYDMALHLRPAYPDALRAAGVILRDRGQFEGALRLFDQAILLDPVSIDAVFDKADLFYRQDRVGDALATYDAALLRTPHEALLWSNRGIMLHDLGRMVEALDSLDAALRADPASAQARLNRGNVLFRLSRFAEAVESFDAALALRAVYPAATCGRGLALKMLGRFAEAMADFETAAAQDPDFAYARSNRGELRLLLGDFARGWPDYEFRFATERQSKPLLATPVSEWDGQHRPGARIAVLADQGNGDTIQFARFLPNLRDTGAAVTFICPPRLQSILQNVTNGIRVRDLTALEEAFDYQIALSSMPGAFGVDEAVLSGSSPYLRAEPDRVHAWGERLGSGGFKIGLCWRGSQNWQCDPNRSIPLAAFASLAALPGVRLISLQMPDNAETQAAGLPLEQLGAAFDAGPHAFVDTAAVMQNLDLVVTCDTSIAHLAGALGRPVSVLLQAIPEWRWMLGRDTSPWYPSMRLFRQTTLGDWSVPIASLVATLAGVCLKEQRPSTEHDD